MTNQDRPHPGNLPRTPLADQRPADQGPGGTPGALDSAGASEQDAALEAALSRLDGLDAVGVHEHVEVYATVDRALRERLAGAEG